MSLLLSISLLPPPLSGYLTSCCQQALFDQVMNYLLTSLNKEKSTTSGVPSSLTNTRTFIQAIGAIW